MATTKTSTAQAKVALDSDPFVKSAQAISQAAKDMSAAVATALETAGVALAAVFGVKAFSGIVDQIHSVIKLGESMANAGHAANRAAGEFYLFHNAVDKGISIKTAAKLIGDNAEVLNRSAGVFRDVAIKLWAVGEKIQGFWLGLVDRLAPVLSKLLDGALAVNLVSAGQKFGDAIVNGLETLYQLTKDGTLETTILKAFKIAFDYGEERLIYFSGTMFRVLRLMFSEAVIQGIADGIEKVQPFFEALAQDLVNSIGNAILKPLDAFAKALDKLVQNIPDFGPGKALKENLGGFNNNLKEGLDTAHGVLAPPPKNEESFEDKIKGAIKNYLSDDFKQSDSLQGEIADFTKSLNDALTKYQKNADANPADSIENNTRRTAFGADSLAAIGGGGNVYAGLSVLDVNKRQLDQLMQINAKLTPHGAGEGINQVAPRAKGNSITRAQSTPPITSPY